MILKEEGEKLSRQTQKWMKNPLCGNSHSFLTHQLEPKVSQDLKTSA